MIEALIGKVSVTRKAAKKQCCAGEVCRVRPPVPVVTEEYKLLLKFNETRDYAVRKNLNVSFM